MIARQFFFDAFAYLQFAQLRESKDETLSALAKRSFKEITYHLRHSSQWMLRLGDGTDESNEKMQEAIDYLWMFTGEMFEQTEADQLLISEGIIFDTAKFKDEWFANISAVLKEATLKPVNKDDFMQSGGRQGNHTEYLGHILAEMQNLQRSHPNAQW
jgi:ring-1,2-phenylacetyl-CoA epoxidase subunit PaaC